MALGIAFVIGVVVAVLACSVGGGIWAYRRVLADRSTGIAVLAALTFGALTFLCGWILFLPAWLAGWLRRRRSGASAQRSGRFVLILCSLAGIAIMVVGLGEVVQDRTDARDTAALRTHGVSTLAQVLSVHYDANGGDPNGWTSIRARFTDATGRSYIVNIGHHDQATERPGDSITVIYDSARPSLAEMAADPQYVRSADGVLVIGLGTAVTGAVVTIVFLFLAARRRRLRPPAGWYADPHRLTAWRFWDGQAWTGHASP